jgi:TPR repeat protein
LEAAMTHVRPVMIAAICISLLSIVGSFEAVTAEAPRQMSPKAAQQYAADSERAAKGDPDAAYRVGEALESGRFGGLKDLNKALSYYKLAAKNGHKEAAARALQLEVELGKAHKAPESAPITKAH